MAVTIVVSDRAAAAKRSIHPGPTLVPRLTNATSAAAVALRDGPEQRPLDRHELDIASRDFAGEPRQRRLVSSHQQQRRAARPCAQGCSATTPARGRRRTADRPPRSLVCAQAANVQGRGTRGGRAAPARCPFPLPSPSHQAEWRLVGAPMPDPTKQSTQAPLDGAPHSQFAKLWRRAYLTYQYHGLWSLMLRAVTFPLRFTPLKRFCPVRTWAGLRPHPGDSVVPDQARSPGDRRDSELSRRGQGGRAGQEHPPHNQPRDESGSSSPTMPAVRSTSPQLRKIRGIEIVRERAQRGLCGERQSRYPAQLVPATTSSS